MGRESSVRRALGEEIRRQREARKWTLQQLCDAAAERGVEVSSVTLHRVEHGKTMLPFDAAQQVFSLLGLPLGYVEEIIHAARRREGVDLTDRSFEALLEEGCRLGDCGDYAAAARLFESAHDRLILSASEGGVDGWEERLH